MKRIFTYIFSMLLLVACSLEKVSQPYGEDVLHELTIKIAYPDDYSDYLLDESSLTITNIDMGNAYSAQVGEDNQVTVQLTNGRYIIQFSGRNGDELFNATTDNVILSDADLTIELTAIASLAGNIIIKEIYCGGCSKAPEEGTYQYDKYVILHNNSIEVAYLDGLCFSMLSPYNSTSVNKWTGDQYAGLVGLADAVWQFGGDGTTFPLQPGEDAVLCQNGAIDHSAMYPLSVNLNRENYFVLYSNTLFTNTSYHPAPGDLITTDRYLNVVQKYGQSNAWAFSVSSPGPVLFKAKDTTIAEYLAQDGVINTDDNVAFIPEEWVLDGVEVFSGSSSTNTKRFSSVVDAGYISQTATFDGKSLHRVVDQENSELLGYEVLIDTNNSSADFYERSEASLHE